MSQIKIQEDLTMGKKRKTHSPQFKAKVALAAITNDETAFQITSRLGVHPTMVSNWNALEEAIDRFGPPDIFNTDQVSQCTRNAVTQVLQDSQVAISMDGRGRCQDNIL